jgi:hypothetical protein
MRLHKHMTSDTTSDHDDEADADPMAPSGNRRERLVLALLATPTIKAAAEVAGVPERTAHRWLREPDFGYTVAVARRHVLAQACTRLVATCGTATDVLRDVACDTSAPAAARVTAARTILELARGLVDVDHIDDRLAALEAAVSRQAPNVPADAWVPRAPVAMRKA